MRVVLPFKLVGQTLVKGRDFPKSVADGSKNSVVIKVDGIPDGCVATGYFKLSWKGDDIYDFTFDGDELVVDDYIVTLPYYANNKYVDYKFSFSLAILEDGVERLTTHPVEIVVEKSNYSGETTNTPDIPESQYNALANRVAEVADLAGGFDADIAALYNEVGLLKENAVVVDDALSSTSENPVKNKVVAAEIQGLYTGANIANERALRALDAAEAAQNTANEAGALANIANLNAEHMLGVNVKFFGAVGNGVKDDTYAIQKALDAAEQTGRPLYFPTGTYLVSKTITTHTRDTDADKQTNNLVIYGAGFGSVIKTTETFDGDYVFYLDVANVQPRSLWVHDFAIDLYADVSGIYFDEIGMKGIVENLWITHKYDKDPTDTNHRAGIECRMATVVTFSRIKIQGNRERIGKGHENIGIICHGSWTNTFTDCDIIFCKWGIYLNSGSDNTIENCRIDENEYGVYQNSTAESLNYMPETRAYPADGSNGVVHKGTFRNLTIRNNRFERNNQYALFLAAYSTGEDTYMYNAQITIENNDFSGLGADIAYQTSARQVFRKAINLYQCKGVVIENNAFAGKAYDESNAESMLQVLAGSKTDDLTIRSNVAITNPLDDGTVVKTSPKISADLLNYKFGKWQPKSLAEQGIVDDIEVDQSTRDRWRSELGDVDTALDSIIAIQESLIGGDSE